MPEDILGDIEETLALPEMPASIKKLLPLLPISASARNIQRSNRQIPHWGDVKRDENARDARDA